MSGGIRKTKIVLLLAAGVVIPHEVGCGPCWDAAVGYTIRGKLVDRDTREPISDAAWGVSSLAGGDTITYQPAVLSDGSQNTPPLDEDGSFTSLLFEGLWGSCYRWETPQALKPPELTRPDQIEVTVVRDGCEQRFLIDLNADTVVDMEFPDDVIELKDPILVGPCDE